MLITRYLIFSFNCRSTNLDNPMVETDILKRLKARDIVSSACLTIIFAMKSAIEIRL